MKKEFYTKLLKTFKQKKIRNFALFLGIAFLFLILTKLSETYTQTVSFDVEIKNVKDEVVLSSKANTKVDVVLNGKGFDLLPYGLFKQNIIFLDAKKDLFSKGKSYYWDAVNNKHIINSLVGHTVNVRSVKPDTLVLQYDVLKTKKVPLLIEQNIEYASGFDVLDVLKSATDSIKLIGSEAVLKNIKAVNTKVLRLVDIKSDIKETIGLDTSQFSNITFIPNTVEVYGKVKRFTEGRISVPIEMKNAPVGKTVNYFPKRIEVIYYVDLENFNNITANDFRVIVNFDNLKEETTRFLDLELVKTSTLLKNTKLSQNKIEFIISE
jgi:hypothetical protein